MRTVIETSAFARKADALLTPEEHAAIIDELANRPLSGVMPRGLGGARKIRFGLQGRGKSGGVRVVYYYFDDDHPVIALTLFREK